MTNPDSELAKAHCALAWVMLLAKIEHAGEVIAWYAANGLTDTPNDIENRRARDEWRKLAKDLRP